jgi:hypothetical protein
MLVLLSLDHVCRCLSCEQSCETSYKHSPLNQVKIRNETTLSIHFLLQVLPSISMSQESRERTLGQETKKQSEVIRMCSEEMRHHCRVCVIDSLRKTGMSQTNFPSRTTKLMLLPLNIILSTLLSSYKQVVHLLIERILNVGLAVEGRRRFV